MYLYAFFTYRNLFSSGLLMALCSIVDWSVHNVVIWNAKMVRSISYLHML